MFQSPGVQQTQDLFFSQDLPSQSTLAPQSNFSKPSSSVTNLTRPSAVFEAPIQGQQTQELLSQDQASQSIIQPRQYEGDGDRDELGREINRGEKEKPVAQETQQTLEIHPFEVGSYHSKVLF